MTESKTLNTISIRKENLVAATKLSVGPGRTNVVCKQLHKSKWKDEQQQLYNKSQSCSSCIHATTSFVVVVLLGNHSHAIHVMSQEFTALGIRCPRDLSLTCVTSSLTVWNKLDSVMAFSGLSRFAPTNFISLSYYMASSVSGQDESNTVLWLATWAGKKKLACLLRTTHCVPQDKISPKAM